MFSGKSSADSSLSGNFHFIFLDALPSPATTPVSLIVSWLVGHTFRFALCRCFWTVTGRQKTTGHHIFSESCDQQLSDFDLEWFRWQEGTSVPRHHAKLEKFTKKWAGLPNSVQQYWFQLLKTLTTWSSSFVSHHKTLDIRIVPK